MTDIGIDVDVDIDVDSDISIDAAPTLSSLVELATRLPQADSPQSHNDKQKSWAKTRRKRKRRCLQADLALQHVTVLSFHTGDPEAQEIPWEYQLSN